MREAGEHGSSLSRAPTFGGQGHLGESGVNVKQPHKALGQCEPQEASGRCIRAGLGRTRDGWYLRETQDPWNSQGWGPLCGEQVTPDI